MKLDHLHISHDQKDTIAAKLEQGVEPNNILDDAIVRDKITHTDRGSLLTRQDIQNNSRQCNISSIKKKKEERLTMIA